MSYIIGRYQEGISLNPFEYALDSEGNELEFETKEEAKEFLCKNGVGGDDLDDCFHYVEICPICKERNGKDYGYECTCKQSRG